MSLAIVKIVNTIVTRGLEPFGMYYGTYKAFVFNREDPKNYSRLKLIIPNVTGNKVLDYWAYPCNNFSGDGYGSQCLPQKGDLVWVEFEQGNIRRPLWKFGYFAKDEKPEELNDYNNYWFKTPGGHLIELDDTNELVRVTSKDNTYIIKLGETEVEPMVLGDTNQAKMEELIDLLLSAKTNTLYGPQPLFNILLDLQTLKDSLSETKSTNKFIGK
jgi:hypothetical protein